ncbi:MULTISPECIES: hypothetical protein [Acinetobacter calcoaceticus/baumannii complex]|nr:MULTISPECIES: hypothetical protein [Acinetobacter calcoaceticus/baumannii complex]MCT9479726.1 hypothetical protein [Acinetobacter baumannii]EXA84103.1 hypothetical protein J508_4056 [Acinetobacter sp. 1289694]EXH76167.1 hypothetical protein J633_2173 [Acinetobacter sp. 216872]KQD28767.1 hypothetical protein APD13_19110 [Acinetobacter pittii]MCG9495806.1 hypothetical protein [Acinetobacter pittii]
MKVRYLKDYEHSKTLDADSYNWLKQEEKKLNKLTSMVALYCTYIECLKQTSTQHSIFDLKSSEALESHLQCFIGFIYTELDTTNYNKYHYSYEVQSVFNKLALLLKISVTTTLLSLNSISEDVEECIFLYKKNKKNIEKIEYYRGWNIFSSDNKLLNLNISIIYDTYGKEFTSKLHHVMIIYGKKVISTTLSKKIGFLISLFRVLVIVYPNIKEIQKAMSSEYAFESMLIVYNLCLIDAKIKNYNIGHFHKRWSSMVDMYNVLVNYGIWQEPITEILRPIYKRCTHKNTTTNLVKNENKQLIHNKLVTQIPISYTDSEAKELIFVKIINEIDHIIYCSEVLTQKTNDKYNFFIECLSKGIVKVSQNNNLKNNVPIGVLNKNNTFRTYYENPFKHKTLKNYPHFLGISGSDKEKDIIKDEIFYSSYNTLYPFLILLINQHPAITESWLINWKLYDNKNNVGLFKIGESWYSKSFKKRRGVNYAEQLIKLNPQSVKIIKDIIKITSIARNYLKSENNLDHEYMLLTSRTAFTEPRKVKKFENGTNITLINNLKKSYEITSYKNGDILLNDNECSHIFQNLTLTRFRASCGVRVYYETMSVNKMSLALGHKEYNPALIDSYLPDTLWKFYTNRWLRIFQNALIYESMKDSVYLFESVDFTKEELDKFINNHAFKDIPHHIEKGFHEINIEKKNNEDKNSYIGIYLITVPLLQIFLSIKYFFEETSYNQKNIKKHLKWWYTSANYVISQIEAFQNNLQQCLYLTKDIIEMYEIAKKNPIKYKIIEGIFINDSK